MVCCLRLHGLIDNVMTNMNKRNALQKKISIFPAVCVVCNEPMTGCRQPGYTVLGMPCSPFSPSRFQHPHHAPPPLRCNCIYHTILHCIHISTFRSPSSPQLHPCSNDPELLYSYISFNLNLPPPKQDLHLESEALWHCGIQNAKSWA
jgi:hypothetical protein